VRPPKRQARPTAVGDGTKALQIRHHAPLV
jgi:hypothetical protein